MFTGKMAFERVSKIETMSAVLTADPMEPESFEFDASPGIEKVLRRCLAKQPGNRFQSAEDLSFAISNSTAISDGILLDDSTLEKPSALLQWSGGVAVVCLILLLGGFLREALDSKKQKNGVSTSPLRKTGIYLDSIQTEKSGNGLSDIRIAPDGKKFVFIDDGGLWLGRLDQVSKPVNLGKNALFRGPMWSPDSQHIAYFIEKQLFRIDINTRQVRLVTNLGRPVAAIGAGGGWFTDNQIVFPGWRTGLLQVSANGGRFAEVLSGKDEDVSFGRAMPLPDGEGLIFPVYSEKGLARIDVWERSGDRKKVLELSEGIIRDPIVSKTGHLIFVHEMGRNELWAVKFSLADLAVDGLPFRIGNGYHPSISRDGSLLMGTGDRPNREIVIVDRNGKILRRIGEPMRGLGMAKLSPDGAYIAVAVNEKRGIWQLWLLNVESKQYQKLSNNLDMELDPRWYPDSRNILYRRWANSLPRTVRRSVLDSNNGIEVMQRFPSDFSRSGRTILVLNTAAEQSEHGYVHLDKTDPIYIPFPKEFAGISNPAISPNDKWLAFFSSETQRRELYLVQFPSLEGKVIVSQHGAQPQAVWHPNGSELFYKGGDQGAMMSVSVKEQGERFEVGEPKRVFDWPENVSETYFDVSGDGQFLMIHSVGEIDFEQPDALLISNWIKEFESEDSERLE